MAIFLTALVSFLIIEILYFKIADKYNVIDKPNRRSSHTQITLRGGGIIFPIALIAGVSIFEPSYWYLALGILAIAIISFLDDVLTLSNKLRIGIHIISVLLILVQIFLNQNNSTNSYFTFSVLDPVSIVFFFCAIILIIGIINAYNFMDGINGITVLYSVVTVGSLFYAQKYLDIYLISNDVFLLLIASLFVFGYFNCRIKAKAFAGDVGSISMALILCFLILQLILQTENIKWLLLLGIYGLDSVATIICRLIRKENIFEAHRSHFYQYLANDKKLSHLVISGLYALVQLLLNVWIIYFNDAVTIVLGFLIVTIAYICVRLMLEGRKRLFILY